jgi:dihydroorotate dehydrogenase
MAVQVAKNKTTSENDIDAVVRDYATAVGHVGKYADILVVNVSSPNTPGLRTLQNAEPLTRLLSGVVGAVNKLDRKTKPAIMVKVSPDEDSEEQISGIVEAVWDSGVDGVIVGNTTKKRPDPLPAGYQLPAAEAKLVLEQGGYSGPQMFERTLALVSKYRKALDNGPKALPAPSKSQPEPTDSTSSMTTTTVDLSTPATTSAFDDLSESAPSVTVNSTPDAAPAPNAPRKVIFATGGITNGRQAREILDAGASVAQIYTALIYGGVGTISRIKQEMRDEAAKQKTATKNEQVVSER